MECADTRFSISQGGGTVGNRNYSSAPKPMGHLVRTLALLDK